MGLSARCGFRGLLGGEFLQSRLEEGEDLGAGVGSPRVQISTASRTALSCVDLRAKGVAGPARCEPPILMIRALKVTARGEDPATYFREWR
jgi:hypothetical protein